MLDLINNLRISKKITWLFCYFVVTEILTKHLPVGTEEITNPSGCREYEPLVTFDTALYYRRNTSVEVVRE